MNAETEKAYNHQKHCVYCLKWQKVLCCGLLGAISMENICKLLLIYLQICYGGHRYEQNKICETGWSQAGKSNQVKRNDKKRIWPEMLWLYGAPGPAKRDRIR